MVDEKNRSIYLIKIQCMVIIAINSFQVCFGEYIENFDRGLTIKLIVLIYRLIC